jgi:hypothetical protein
VFSRKRHKIAKTPSAKRDKFANNENTNNNNNNKPTIPFLEGHPNLFLVDMPPGKEQRLG